MPFTLAELSDLNATGASNTIGATSDPLAFENFIPDTLPAFATESTPVLNPNTGTLSKATDTILDLAGIFGKAVIGSQYPTGQVSPQQLQAATTAAKQETAATTSGIYKPLLIGGGVLAAVVILALILKKD